MATVSSEAVKIYWPLFESRARRFVGAKGAEFDDLVQEAAISGWLSMEAGYEPNVLIMDRACMRYVRSLHKGGWRLVSEGFAV